MKNIITITHSNEGVRVSCDGTSRTFSNPVYLAEAYAVTARGVVLARELIVHDAAKQINAIDHAVHAIKPVDVGGEIDGPALLANVKKLREILIEATQQLVGF